MRIQHNIMAMNAYRNYNNNTSALSKNLEKLSSGYKINRAGDDAAGLAISEKMRAQIAGLEAAQKNVKDGVSLVKTAEGAMQEIQDMLNRMVYLGTQSANGTYDNEVDRANLQKEVNSLKAEIDRIADSANFNGINLLDGSIERKTEISVTNIDDAKLTVVAEGQLGKTPQAGILTIDLSQVTITEKTAGNGIDDFVFQVAGKDFYEDKEQNTKIDITQNLNGLSEITAADIGEQVDGSWIQIDGSDYKVSYSNGKLTLTAENPPTQTPQQEYDVKLEAPQNTVNNGQQIAVVTVKEPISAAAARMYGQAEFTLTTDIVKDGGVLKLGDTSYTFAVGKNSIYAGGTNVIDLTDMSKDTADADLLRAAADRLSKAAVDNKQFYVGTDRNNDTVKIRLTEKEGGIDYSKNNLAGDDGKGGATKNDADAADWAGLVQVGTAKVSGTPLTLQIGDTSAEYNQLKVSVKDIHVSALGISDLDISTQAGAAAAIDKIKAAINTVSSTRGDLGATQNRLEHTLNNLSVMTENITDAESTIRDTDVADEMMAYTKNNILIQSAQAMLAQANQVPQGVLQLLQ